MTSTYLSQSLATPSRVNFKLLCVELFEIAADATETLLAGEIGFSVGRVYSSLCPLMLLRQLGVKLTLLQLHLPLRLDAAAHARAPGQVAAGAAGAVVTDERI